MAKLTDHLNSHLVRLKKGDPKSFKVVYYCHVDALYSFVLRFVKSRNLTDDIVQDSFLRVWETRESIDLSRSFQGYLYKIAKNLVLNTLSRSKQENSILVELLNSTNKLSNGTLDEVYFNETSKVIKEGISKLPPQQRKVIELCKIQGRTYDQVAKQLHISSNTINVHMVNALRFLRHYLVLHESTKKDAGASLP